MKYKAGDVVKYKIPTSNPEIHSFVVKFGVISHVEILEAIDGRSEKYIIYDEPNSMPRTLKDSDILSKLVEEFNK